MPQFINTFGPQSPHLYRMLELADPIAHAIWFEGRSWNFHALKAKVDGIALGLHDSLGVKDGDIVAVSMTNSPKMTFTILALTRLGAAPALFNNALRDDTQLHCVKLPNASLILSTRGILRLMLRRQRSIRTAQLRVGTFRPIPASAGDSIIEFPFPDPSVTPASSLPPVPLKFLASVAVLVYISGTSGEPNACSAKNDLILAVSCIASQDKSNPKKYLKALRIYSCMPLFYGTSFFAGFCYSMSQSA